jgi:hypothetical protein
MVMITHDPEDLAFFGADTIHLRDGAVCVTPMPRFTANGQRLQLV